MNATLPPPPTDSHTLITPAELSAMLRAGERCELVDVRTPGEFRGAHVAGSKNAPLHHLDPAHIARLLPAAPGTAMVLICASGARARQSAPHFAQHPNVHVLDGGVAAWMDAGLPVLGTGRAWAMERQVRAAAGLVVLAGCALGFAANPWFYALAAFVGGGLVFSAVTNTCGMARVLTLLPWNR